MEIKKPVRLHQAEGKSLAYFCESGILLFGLFFGERYAL